MPLFGGNLPECDVDEWLADPGHGLEERRREEHKIQYCAILVLARTVNKLLNRQRESIQVERYQKGDEEDVSNAYAPIQSSTRSLP